MAENGNGKGGVWKEALGWIVAVAAVFLILARRKQRTVHNFMEIFRENPVAAIVILIIAVAAAIGITALRRYLQNKKK